MQTAAVTPTARARHDRGLNEGLAAKAGHLILFFFAAYVLAWLPMAAAILAARGAIALPVPETGLIALATVGICLAGIGTAALEAGRTGVLALMAQVLRWRVRPGWYIVALFGPALFPAGGFLLGLALGSPVPPAPPVEVWLSLPLVLAALVIPALFEEVGWRGYALPRLQHRFGSLTASLVIGVIWAGVHLPLWLIPGFGFAAQSVPLYVVQVVAISIVLTWLYNSSGGSVLLTAVAHAAVNGWPMPWSVALQSLPEDSRGFPVQVLITAATVLAALVVVFGTRGLTLTGGSRDDAASTRGAVTQVD